MISVPGRCFGAKVKVPLACDECGGVGGYSLLSAGESELFRGGGFYRDAVRRRSYHVGEALLHCRDMWAEFWSFSAYRGIDVAESVAFCGYQVNGFFQDYLAIDVECVG